MTDARAPVSRTAQTTYWSASVVFLMLTCIAAPGWSHGVRPRVTDLVTTSDGNGTNVHALTTNQGVYAQLKSQYRWVCEDAVFPLAETVGLAIQNVDPPRWLIATRRGLFLSNDSGCSYTPVEPLQVKPSWLFTTTKRALSLRCPKTRWVCEDYSRRLKSMANFNR